MMNLLGKEQQWEQEHRNYLQDQTMVREWRQMEQRLQQDRDHFYHYEPELDKEWDYYHDYNDQEDYYMWEEQRQELGREQKQGRRGREECLENLKDRDSLQHEQIQGLWQVKELDQEQKPRLKSYQRDLEEWRQLQREEAMWMQKPVVENVISCPELVVPNHQHRRTSQAERRRHATRRRWGSVVAGAHIFLCNLMRPINQREQVIHAKRQWLWGFGKGPKFKKTNKKLNYHL